MTENGEPIHELGIQDAEGNFTALAALDYDTVNDELSLKHLQQDVELRTDGTSWNPNAPLGDETQPVPGTSHFNAVSVDQGTIDSLDGTDLQYDVVGNNGSPIGQTDEFERRNIIDSEVLKPRETAKDENGLILSAKGTTHVDGVSTDAVLIWDARINGNSSRSSLLLVSGTLDGDVTNYFTDLVQFTRVGGAAIVQSGPERGTPAGRTYSEEGTTGKILLAMESGTYNVTVEGVSLEADS